jgi:hypothetical protein
VVGTKNCSPEEVDVSCDKNPNRIIQKYVRTFEKETGDHRTKHMLNMKYFA